MKTRRELPQLLNKLGLTGHGVEVGACRGKFSEHILDNWHGKKLYSVDLWEYQPDVKMDASNVSQKEHDKNYELCKELLRRFGRRSAIVRAYSVEAAKLFPDGSFCFVYLDARHDYRSKWADLNAWWPKIYKYGLIAGHDYKNSFVRKNLVEVKRAVDNFALIHNRPVHVTTDDNLPSWYIFRE